MPDQRLLALAAVDEALKDPVRVLRTVTASADFDEALHALQESFGWDEVQARLVMQLPIGNTHRDFRERVAQDLQHHDR
ncbi:hypothetical protein [Ornithinimicrobium humiphilum]|nr:hypothetical protein [Ornithinimicrobium humiphilum]